MASLPAAPTGLAVKRKKKQQNVCDSAARSRAAPRYIYVVGGFTSVRTGFCGPYACGDTDAGSYRAYMSDVWYADMLNVVEEGQALEWLSVTSVPGWTGRGAHAMAIMRIPLGCTEVVSAAGEEASARLKCNYGGYALWIFGGRTGDTESKAADELLNDVWYAPFPNTTRMAADGQVETPLQTMTEWTRNRTEAEWAPRAGHVAIVDPPSAANLEIQKVYVYGGEDADGRLLGDCWSWGGRAGLRERWLQDYTPDAWFKYGDASKMVYGEGQPQHWYVTPDADVEFLQRFRLPLSENEEDRKRTFGLVDFTPALHPPALYGYEVCVKERRGRSRVGRARSAASSCYRVAAARGGARRARKRPTTRACVVALLLAPHLDVAERDARTTERASPF